MNSEYTFWSQGPIRDMYGYHTAWASRRNRYAGYGVDVVQDPWLPNRQFVARSIRDAKPSFKGGRRDTICDSVGTICELVAAGLLLNPHAPAGPSAKSKRFPSLCRLRVLELHRVANSNS